MNTVSQGVVEHQSIASVPSSLSTAAQNRGDMDARDISQRGVATHAASSLSANVPALEIRKLRKNYGLKPVLRRVDLELQQGQRMALLGANGAGKTTLLRLLACLARPDAGSVSILGLDSAHDAQEIRHHIGFIGHQPYVYEELTALENLLFFSRMFALEHGRARAHELLQRVGLERRKNDRVGAFSRGQMQRLAWARALLHAPHLLLLDEPDTGLDQEGNELVSRLLTEHTASGGSMLFTTHLLDRALLWSDHIAMLSGGRVVYRERTAGLALDELQRVYQEVGR